MGKQRNEKQSDWEDGKAMKQMVVDTVYNSTCREDFTGTPRAKNDKIKGTKLGRQMAFSGINGKCRVTAVKDTDGRMMILEWRQRPD